ncbi:hypothetical protein, partial [Escherichia coli]|uniref:hypothetical protein n=1 Tax=Escherichia coli TaxID=562 RepID=UPI001412BEC8
ATTAPVSDDATTAPAPVPPAEEGAALTASYQVQDSGADYVEAGLLVRNGTARSADWQVELRFNGGDTGIRASSGPG